MHEESCTKCEELGLNQCKGCKYDKVRKAQNLGAALISVVTVCVVSYGVRFITIAWSAPDSYARFGSAELVGNYAGAAVFIGMVVMFALREPITKWVMEQARIAQMKKEDFDDDEEEDEDDE